MYPVSDELREMLLSDNVYKVINVYLPELDMTIDVHDIVNQSMTLTESVGESTDIKFGECPSSEFKLSVANIDNLAGKRIEVSFLVDHGKYTLPIGKYTIKSCKRTNDLRIREIIAYDDMDKFDIDVTTWYNGLTFPITVKAMRESLCEFCGVEFEEQELPNDDIQINKTLNAEVVKGIDVLHALGEINAAFGHFGREGKFKFINLTSIGLYPAEDLYPSEDLYPAESGERLAIHADTRFEEYYVHDITGVKIRNSQEDVGTFYGDNEDNVYIIESNILTGDMDAEKKRQVAERIYVLVKGQTYVPHKTETVGLPYLEVGDSLTILKGATAFDTFIFKRTLTGIYVLKDTLEAGGSEYRSTEPGLVSKYTELNGKYFNLRMDTDGLHAEIGDVEAGLTTQLEATASGLRGEISSTADGLRTEFEATASGITATITDLQNDVTTQFSAMQGEINLKVDANGIINAINVSTEGIKISASKLEISGMVTFSDLGDYVTKNALSTKGQTTINGGNITTGVIEADVLYTSMTDAGWAMNANYLWNSAGGICLKGSGNVAFACGMTNSYEPGDDTAAAGGKIRLRHSGTAYFAGEVECGSFSSYGSSSVTGTLTAYYLGNTSGFSDISRDNNDCAKVLYGSNLASASYVRAQVASDGRLKTITGSPEQNLIDAMRDLEVVQFQYKPGAVISDIDDGRQRFGLVAQQARNVFEKYGFWDSVYSFIEHDEPGQWAAPYIDDGDEIKPDYTQLISVLIYWCQMLNNKLDEMEAMK